MTAVWCVGLVIPFPARHAIFFCEIGETMDLEQLKLILEAVSNAGEGAKEFGIWYLIATAFVANL